MKIAVVTAIPTPYRDPFWGVVNALENVDLDVYYCAAGKPDRPWQVDWPREFNYIELPSWNLARFRGADASAYWVPGLQSQLREGGYDAAIIGGYNHPCMLAAMRTCVRSNVPYFLACETYQSRGGRLSSIKHLIVRRVCCGAAGGLPTGRQASEFLTANGIGPERQIRIPNVPNVVEWRSAVGKLRRDGEQVRESLGLNKDDRTLVFVARMIPKKRPKLLVEAFAAADVPQSKLIMIGSGPLVEECGQLASSLSIQDRVVFPGFCDRETIRRWFAVSQAFVMPSSETWGVAPIEALASGLPVILADGVGSHPDVVRSQSDGWVVPTNCRESLSHAMKDALSNPRSPEDVLLGAEHLGSDFDYNVLASRLVDGLQRLTATSGHGASPGAA